jgi:PAS domain S-box-containing protein
MRIIILFVVESVMKDRDKKNVVILLRWTVIVVVSYLILFGKGRVADPRLSQLLIIGYILSNLLLVLVPKAWFSNLKLFYSLVLVDTGIVSFGMYLSEKMTTDFYLVFFLIIIFASLSRNFRLLMTIGGITAFLYGVLLYFWGFFASENSSSYILRIPFIFIMTAFYGYIVQTFSEEKRRQLTISEDKYRGLFENANDGIIILKSPQFLVANVNKEVERLTGYEKKELLGKAIVDLIAVEEGRKLAYLEEVVEKGEARTDSFPLLRKDGMPLEADLSTKRIDLGDESFYQVIFRDLTEQRKLEKKIRESKRNLEAIFDAIRDQLSIQAPDYHILRVNRAVIEKYHTEFRELLGKKCYEAYYQRTMPCEKCPISVTIQTQQPSFSIMKIPEKDTTLRIFSYPVSDDKGSLFAVIEYVQDITEEERLQEQLIQSEKLAGIGALASGIAHEINNPLSGVVGMAELCMAEENPEEIKSYLTDILNCAQRIGEISQGLRSYSRIAKDGSQVLADVNEVLDSSLKMVRLGIRADSVEVMKKFQPVEKIEVDVGEIQQVFSNLITNALQAINGKGGMLTLSTRSLKDSVEVKVSDNGVGIPPKYLKQIFDPFFTTKKPGEGTGLGLNIVYRIVTKYEGTIDVESKVDVGTTFTVKFPIRRDIG